MRNVIFFAFFLSACVGSQEVPKDVLSQEKMGSVLYDVVQADEMIDYLKLKDSTFQFFGKRTALYDTVFTLHGVSKAVFKKSLDFYEGRPDLMKEMLDDLQRKIADTASKKRLQKESVLKKMRTSVEK